MQFGGDMEKGVRGDCQPKRMAGLWWRSHAELASWRWAVPARRAGAWVPVQQTTGRSYAQPGPWSPLLILPLHRSGGEPPGGRLTGPGGCVRWGWGGLLRWGRVGELDHDSLPTPGFSGASPHSSPAPTFQPPPTFHPASCPTTPATVPTMASGPRPCLKRCSPLLISPPRR